MTFLLSSDLRTRDEYPRDFEFRVCYRLEGQTLRIGYQVTNLDERIMYFGLGGHPGFRVPMEPGEPFGACRIRFSPEVRPERIRFTREGLVSGERTPFLLEDGVMKLNHRMFDEDAVVLSGAGHEAALESARSDIRLEFRFPGMDYVGFWHMPGTDAPYVCVEPWCCLPAPAGAPTVFEERADLLRLDPGGTYRNEWTVTVRD